MRYLLDTCVISELVSPMPDPKVIEWVDSVDEDKLFLSVITIGEIKKGIDKLPNSSRKIALKEWLEDNLLVRFNGRFLAIDSLIAATALKGELKLVTRNEGDFTHSGVAFLNPWGE